MICYCGIGIFAFNDLVLDTVPTLVLYCLSINGVHWLMYRLWPVVVLAAVDIAVSPLQNCVLGTDGWRLPNRIVIGE